MDSQTTILRPQPPLDDNKRHLFFEIRIIDDTHTTSYEKGSKTAAGFTNPYVEARYIEKEMMK